MADTYESAFSGWWVRKLSYVLFMACSVLCAGDAPKICLTMIVKNESAIIERCLGRVQGFVDAICICDTGSTDNTVEIVENFLERTKIPGKVYHHVWKNFGHNRTLSAAAAQEMLPLFGFMPDKTYLLLLDADMLLVVPDSFDKGQLTGDSILLRQKNGTISYDNVRLILASLPWKCVGPTHEYWESKLAHSQQRVETLWIDDRNDGGCKSDKFERDVRLLTQGLIEEPENARYMFYLAQSYMCLGKYDEAIHWYQKRAEKHGFAEEAWYARLMIGDCYKAKNEWNKALQAYLEAYSYRAHRAEPLRRISAYYLHKGMKELAYLFAKKGASIPYPTQDVLFIADPVYHYELDEDLSIAAYYCQGGRRDGLMALDRLLYKRTTPQGPRGLARTNIQFYIDALTCAEFHPIIFSLPPISQGSSSSYRPMNPSIQKTKDGYVVLCRTVNWIHDRGHYSLVEPQNDKLFVTRNFLLQYSKDFTLLSQKEIIDDLNRERVPGVWCEGLDDCRLVEDCEHPSQWAMVGTTHDVHPRYIPKQAYCEIEEAEKSWYVRRFVPLKGLQQDQCEKNWLPFCKNGDLYCIYAYDPLQVWKIDRSTGDYSVQESRPSEYTFGDFRGSAGPVAFDNGYLVVVHEVSFLQNPARLYTHRFVYLDKDFRIRKISTPFRFRHHGVEFCCGMTMNHEGTHMLVSFGVDDKEAYVAAVDPKIIRSMLYSVP